MDDTPEKPQAPDARYMAIAARKVVMAERRVAVAALMHKGYSMREAAEELGLTFGQVASVYRALVREAEKSFLENADRLRARALMHNRNLQKKCWAHLERAEKGHVKREQVGGTAAGAKPIVERLSHETDFMSEARILETLRKLQADELKILGFTPPEAKPPDSGGGVVVQRGIVIVNSAGLPATVPWLDTIKAGVAKQGIGLLPSGDVSQNEIVAEEAEKPGEPKP